MRLNLDPIAPYATLIKAGLVLALVAVIFFGGRSCGVQSQEAVVEAAAEGKARAEAQRDEARTAAEAWQGKAEGCVAANQAWEDVVGSLNQELALARGENARLEKAGRAAIAAADARAREADRTLKRFVAQFHAQSRDPQCAATLARLEQACPAFEGY